jgi:hypothetical protein
LLVKFALQVAPLFNLIEYLGFVTISELIDFDGIAEAEDELVTLFVAEEGSGVIVVGGEYVFGVRS